VKMFDRSIETAGRASVRRRPGPAAWSVGDRHPEAMFVGLAALLLLITPALAAPAAPCSSHVCRGSAVPKGCVVSCTTDSWCCCCCCCCAPPLPTAVLCCAVLCCVPCQCCCCCGGGHPCCCGRPSADSPHAAPPPARRCHQPPDERRQLLRPQWHDSGIVLDLLPRLRSAVSVRWLGEQ
jgi:hypothetical protein